MLKIIKVFPTFSAVAFFDDNGQTDTQGDCRALFVSQPFNQSSSGAVCCVLKLNVMII